MKRYLSLIEDNEIVSQIPTNLSDQEIIEIDEMMREYGLLDENQEIAATQKIDQ